MKEEEKNLIERFAQENKEVFFIQIGANDGISGDLIHDIILKYKWKGILVEPLPYLFKELKRTYKNKKELSFENSAIVHYPEYEKRTMYYLKDTEDDLPTWYRQLGSFDKKVVLKHKKAIPNIYKYLTAEQVSCLTFKELLEKYKISYFDFLYIDAEGYDFEILQGVNLVKYLPKMIVYEHKHLSFWNKWDCRSMLKQDGYRIKKFNDNTVAY